MTFGTLKKVQEYFFDFNHFCWFAVLEIVNMVIGTKKVEKNSYFLLTYFILNTFTTLKAMKCKYVNNLVAIIMF